MRSEASIKVEKRVFYELGNETTVEVENVFSMNEETETTRPLYALVASV